MRLDRSDCHFLPTQILALQTQACRRASKQNHHPPWTAYFSFPPTALLPALVTACELPGSHQTSCSPALRGKKQSAGKKSNFVGSAWPPPKQTEHVLKRPHKQQHGKHDGISELGRSNKRALPQGKICCHTPLTVLSLCPEVSWGTDAFLG